MSKYIKLTKKQNRDFNWMLTKINNYLNDINYELDQLLLFEYPDDEETPVIFIYDEEFINSYSNLLSNKSSKYKTHSYEVKLIDMQCDLEQIIVDNEATEKDIFFYSFIIKVAQKNTK